MKPPRHQICVTSVLVKPPRHQTCVTSVLVKPPPPSPPPLPPPALCPSRAFRPFHVCSGESFVSAHGFRARSGRLSDALECVGSIAAPRWYPHTLYTCHQAQQHIYPYNSLYLQEQVCVTHD